MRFRNQTQSLEVTLERLLLQDKGTRSIPFVFSAPRSSCKSRPRASADGEDATTSGTCDAAATRRAEAELRELTRSVDDLRACTARAMPTVRRTAGGPLPDAREEAPTTRLVVGPRGSAFGGHNHPPAILLLLEVVKKWYFSAPRRADEAALLGPRAGEERYGSGVNFPGRRSDFFARIDRVAVQRPGELMAIPHGTYHYVANFNRTIAVQWLVCRSCGFFACSENDVC